MRNNKRFAKYHPDSGTVSPQMTVATDDFSPLQMAVCGIQETEFGCGVKLLLYLWGLADHEVSHSLESCDHGAQLDLLIGSWGEPVPERRQHINKTKNKTFQTSDASDSITCILSVEAWMISLTLCQPIWLADRSE